MPTPVIIDCDPGHDDAMALMLALASPELEVVAVTTVAGNQTLEKVTANAIRVLDVVGAHAIPVAAGADRALIHPAGVAGEVHGETGPRRARPAAAVARARSRSTPSSCWRRELRKRPLTLIPIGPLTNIALLLAIHPELAARIERIVLMGGAIGLGNVTPGGRVQRLGRPGGRQARLQLRPGRDDGRPRRHPPRDALAPSAPRRCARAATPARSSPTCTPSTGGSTRGLWP